MNFLLHRHLAARDLGSPLAGVGAMLPDLWRMADRRVRPARSTYGGASADPDPLAAILAGIDHHLAADRWFHETAAFVEGERLTAERFRGSRVTAPKLGLFAHVAWELCLDGALLRRDGLDPTLAALREGFTAAVVPAGAAANRHHFDHSARPAAERTAFDAAMRRLFTEIARGPWIAGYQHGAGLVQRIDGMRARLGLGRLGATDADRLAMALDDLSGAADTALASLIGRR